MGHYMVSVMLEVKSTRSKSRESGSRLTTTFFELSEPDLHYLVKFCRDHASGQTILIRTSPPEDPTKFTAIHGRIKGVKHEPGTSDVTLEIERV